MPRGGPRPNSGGPRENSGRKRKASKWSDSFKAELWRCVRKKQRETKRSLQQCMVDIVHADYHKPQHRIAAYRAIQDALVERAAFKTVEEHKYSYSPVILPPMKGDPTRVDMEATPIEPPQVH